MVDLAQAVLTQLVEVIVENGGHVLGLRGDGVFACFGGPGSDKVVDVSLALGAAAFALDATEGALNELLALSGLEPVRVRAGADHGRPNFVRTGVAGASEVNVIRFAANFAAKCEKVANSWELVVGEAWRTRCLIATCFPRAWGRPRSTSGTDCDGLTPSTA